MIFMTFKVLMGGGSRNDRERVAHCWGLTSLEMAPHWRRLRTAIVTLDWRDLPHAVVNPLTEWVRLDAQRAGKVMFWFFVFWLTAAASFWWVL